MIWCCKGCENRHPYCHAECEEYKEQKAEHDKLKAKHDRQKDISAAINRDRGNKVYKAMKDRRYKNI